MGRQDLKWLTKRARLHAGIFQLLVNQQFLAKKMLILGHFWSSSPVGNLKNYIKGIAIEGFDTFSIYHINDILA
jgi:hypothetical protein